MINKMLSDTAYLKQENLDAKKKKRGEVRRNKNPDFYFQPIRPGRAVTGAEICIG